jgi:mannose-1-phosphate guanylyltransferase
MQPRNEWAIVLAGGDGTRLSILKNESGASVPKQFWSVRNGRSLLADALARAGRVVPLERTVVVVAEHHREFWEPELRSLPPGNVVVQPKNRGTAVGVLLPLLSVLRRDPNARVILLPSDHFVAREGVLASSLRLALDAVDTESARTVLLGIAPAAPETSYGWIVPTTMRGKVAGVAAFVEKPDARTAQHLLQRGAVWNSFALAAVGDALIALYERALPGLVRRVRAAMEDGQLDALYAELETRDFCRDLLQGAEAFLRITRVPFCGWTDLGTPERVAACIEKHGREAARAAGRFDLSAALRRLGLLHEGAACLYLG